MDRSSEITTKSDREIMLAIKENAWYLDKVERTPERCLEAVKQNGRTLSLIPKNLQSVSLCLEAVKQDASAIRDVSKRIMTHDICLEAVRNDGTIIAYSTYIPDKFRTKELFLEAIKQNGMALEYVPNMYKSERFCRIAIENNGLALKFVPKNILSKELFLLAVEQNGLALEYVPSRRRSKKLCDVAVNNNVLALEHVPNRYKTTELCNAALNLSWRCFPFVSQSMYTLRNCIEIYERILKECDNLSELSYDDCSCIEEIAKRLPEDINNDIQIIRLQRQLRVREFKRKYFDKEKQKFITIEKIYRGEYEVKEFDVFIDFYEHLDADLKDANLLDYDFKELSLTDFNIEGAYINSNVLVEQQLYDNSYYDENVKDYDCKTECMISAENEVVEAISVLHDVDLIFDSTLNDNSSKIFYISDIHLNHKLLKAFPTHATELEVKMYIRQLVKKLIDSASDISLDDYLLIAGDTSFNFEISTVFYTELVEYMKSKFYTRPRRIVVVLGNHELWDFNRRGVSQSNSLTLDEIIQQYRDLFSDLGICFLQNDLLLSDGTIILEEKLKSINQDELKFICLKSPFVILGGLGFSGLNSQFNATQGIYRQTIMSLDKDIELTNQFKFIYNSVKSALGEDKVIILTHTPKENWWNDNYNRNWIYVNGHTHRNDYCCDEEKAFYSDNQIGYYSTNIALKYFKLSNVCDIFKYYPTGIYSISREQYLDFNRGVGIRVTFNRTGTIHMLKNNNIYCFLLENQNTGKMYLLNGGSINKLEHNDINYYFERMSIYADSIRGLFSNYNKALKSISNSIKVNWWYWNSPWMYC